MGFFYIYICTYIHIHIFPTGSMAKNLPASAGNADSIPGPGRTLKEGNSNSLQHSCQENPMGRGAWRATVHGIAKSCTWLSNETTTHIHMYCYTHTHTHKHTHIHIIQLWERRKLSHSQQHGWINLEDTMLSGRSQREKSKYCLISTYIQNLKMFNL